MKKNEFDSRMFDDIRELCSCCAKSVVVISEKYAEDPRLVSELFLEAYKLVQKGLEESK